MRRLPQSLPPSPPQFRFFSTSLSSRQSPVPSETPKPKLKPTHILAQKTLDALQSKQPSGNHPQTPLPLRGFGPFTRNAETGKRLTFTEREEEKAKEYLYEQPDPNQPLPPLLLRPPGLTEAPTKGIGHGSESRRWWQKEFEIWFGRYQRPFDVQSQLSRHKTLNSYNTEWSPKADRRSVRKSHGKFFMSPHALFKADKAKYAPNFSGQTITSPAKDFEAVTYCATRKATVFAIFSTQMAHRMCKPYLEAIEEAFPSDPRVGIVRVQFEEHWAKMAIIKYYLKSRYLQPMYSLDQQESYILTNRFTNRREGEGTHITNTQVGYILLVDSAMRIRWMATGMPWPGELETVKKGVARLIGEQVKGEEIQDVDYEDHVEITS